MSTRQDLEAVASIWAAHAGRGSQSFVRGHASDPAAQRLREFPLDVLRTSAHDVMSSLPYGSDLPVAQWLAQAELLSGRGARGAGTGGEAERVRANARKISDLLDRRRAQGRVSTVRPEHVAQALEVLATRNGRLASEGRVLRRPARWLVEPSAHLIGAPVLEADDVELAVVALLSATTGEWQFSATPQGRMFTHAQYGYARRDDERTYVTGLSGIVDAAAGLIDSHRDGAGGRVRIGHRWVRCPGCNCALAGIGAPVRTMRPAFGVCEDVLAQRRARAR